MGLDAKLEQDPSAQQSMLDFPWICALDTMRRNVDLQVRKQLWYSPASTSVWIFRGPCGAYTYSRDQTQHHIVSAVQGGANAATLSTGMQRISRYRYLIATLQLTPTGKSNKCRSLGHPLCIHLSIAWEWRRVRNYLQCHSSESSCERLFSCTKMYTIAHDNKKQQEWLVVNSGHMSHVWVPVQWESGLMMLARENGQS